VGGGAHSCARRADGTVWCWGANTSGQLGDGVTLSSPRPLLARVACE
jgi:alpha-tubulin suppressor-like RCC1 family protein